MLTHSKEYGFSLIELMIALIIIAIITSFAVPTYQRYLRRTHRRQAEQLLQQASLDLESHYRKHLTYLGAILPKEITSRYYHFQLKALESNSFTLTATPIGTQKQDQCGMLSINQWHQKQPDRDGCWN